MHSPPRFSKAADFTLMPESDIPPIAERTPLSDTIDQLRDAIADEPLENSWRREFALIGIFAALFGAVVWYAQLEDRNGQTRALLSIRSELAGEYAWLEPGFRQGLTTYLQAGNRLRVVDPVTPHDNPVPSGSSEMSRVARLFSDPKKAEWLVEIRLSAPLDIGRVSVELVLRDAKDSRVVHGAELHSDLESVSDLAARTALQVFDWLSIDPFTHGERETADAMTPLSTPAMEGFSRGLSALNSGDGRRAISHLETALDAAPGHPIVHAMLAESYDLLGYRTTAVSQIEAAIVESSGLPREHRLAIEARRHFLKHEWVSAAERYGALATFYPEKARYGLAHAEVLLKSRELVAAHRALDQVQTTTFPGDPRVSLLRARVFYEGGDWAPGLQAARTAMDDAKTLGHRGTLASALIFAAELAAEDELTLLDEAEALFVELDNPIGRTQVLRQRGKEHVAQGELAMAENEYLAALAIASRVGNDAELASGMQSLAIVRDLQGRMDEGLRLKRRVLENYQRRDVQYGAGITLEAIIISLVKLGRLNEADAMLVEARDHFEKHDDAIGLAWIPYRSGRLNIARGEFARARVSLTQALENSRERPEGSLELHARFELARLSARQGLPGSQLLLERCLEGYLEAGLDLDHAIARLMLARVLHRTGATELAERFADQSVQTFRESEASYYLAQGLASRVWWGSRQSCEELSVLLPKIGHRNSELLARVALARCRDEPPSNLLRGEVTDSELLEPKLALLALDQPEAARVLGRQHDWHASEYWQ